MYENEVKENKITVRNLYKIFGKNTADALKMLKKGAGKDEILSETGATIGVNDANFDVFTGEIFVIMGLSGSGKSTLLRCLNRLIEPTSGSIIIDGYDVVDADHNSLREIRRKKMSMVFQNFGLLPHRTVIDNIAFGLEIQEVKFEERTARAMQAVETVGLQGYEDMTTSELSGGMQQRVGLARALTTEPEILLMDEAFSALDPLIRNNMQDELLSIQRKVQKTIVFITHDLDEALKLGDRIAIMKDGVIVQVGASEEILSTPANDYVKSFVENVDTAKVITASSIMFSHAERILTPKSGPKHAVRIMKKEGISYLPVTNNSGIFKGYVYIDDAARLVKENIHTLESIIKTDIPKTLPSVYVAELLPLVIDNDKPIAVIDENEFFLGVVARAAVISEITGTEYNEK